jgi:hypothetical protein
MSDNARCKTTKAMYFDLWQDKRTDGTMTSEGGVRLPAGTMLTCIDLSDKGPFFHTDDGREVSIDFYQAEKYIVSVDAPPDAGKAFGVWCRVSGGVTGHREAWLKANGVIRIFTSRDDAQKVASDLNRNVGKNSMASFNYSVKEYEHGC